MISESVLYYATPHIEDINHRSRLEHILNRDLRPMWAPASWVHDTERKYYAVCHVTEYGSAMHFAKYGDLDWLLVEGNRYREYAAHRDD